MCFAILGDGERPDDTAGGLTYRCLCFPRMYDMGVTPEMRATHQTIRGTRRMPETGYLSAEPGAIAIDLPGTNPDRLCFRPAITGSSQEVVEEGDRKEGCMNLFAE